MKPRKKGGLVGPNFNMYGVGSPKICDVFIRPGNISAVSRVFYAQMMEAYAPVFQNTSSTTLLIGSKAAVLLRELEIISI